MIKLPIITDWNICTPTLFRFLDKKYADAFFTDGSIRLSSFSQFHNHIDEQMLDKQEGKAMFVHRTNQGGGQTIEVFARYGTNAYILSTSMRYDTELMKAFNSDSYIRINDSTNFGIAISRYIQGLTSAFEGPCLYQSNKIIERDLGYIDITKFRDKVKKNLLDEFVNSQMQHYPLFLKDKPYAHQSEYRFVWIIRDKTYDYIDIKVPEAIKFCQQPNSLTE